MLIMKNLLLLIAVVVVLVGCASSAKTETSSPAAEVHRKDTTEKLDDSGRVVERRTTEVSGRAGGTGSKASGDKVDQKLESQPATVSVDDAGVVASGGGGRTDTSAKGSSQIWVQLMCGLFGIAALAAGAGLLNRGNRRGAMTCFGVSAGCFLMAFFPEVLIFILIGVTGILALMYLPAEWRASQGTEGLRAAMQAATLLNDEQKAAWVESFRKTADEHDRKEYLKWRSKDNLDLPSI